ncbi:hypothetical protein [Mycolicibacterium holsaticum]|uniref:hypothetical protein n=1 Tax=Mycolicibacterium holsaticum TaxID=152142 RepID=UPI001E526653|nr:hypothetical protein [Mycolicibacterium holsaticum]MDA4107832.1 hypothetical protein [Mycolicibacterium holsaticum DSM 44478 = JCM 12374]UNC07832.1 hypothetical protein H5U41_14975 [Mycolicibacterium holsaticum DSM 44478 = JCM 12374]
MPKRTKTVPIDVAARVVGAATTVPLLSDPPFTATGVLERGIHLHWALPDALAKADAQKSRPPRFRGVPDLWLVVRFNPVSGNAARTHREWIVDSVAEAVTPLAEWQPPAGRAADRIHTAPGVLARVAPGWGEWALDEPFDQLTTAYYPSCRRRLGFHDDLADLGSTPSGTVSYAVVGWYSSTSFDPFYRTLLRRLDKLGHRADLKSFTEFAVPVANGAVVAEPSWNPQLSVKDMPPPPAAETTMLLADADFTDELLRSSVTATRTLADAFQSNGGTAQHVVVDALMPAAHQAHTVLHGSIVGVPVRQTRLIGFSSLKTDGVALYPNLQRAMADVAARTGADTEVDYLDMMLGKLGQQSGTVGGVIDLPGAQHARTFQGVPGRSTWFARLDIYPKLNLQNLGFTLADLGGSAAVPVMGNWLDLIARSAAIAAPTADQLQSQIPDAVLSEPPQAQPSGPSDGEIIEWIGDLRAAFATAQHESTHPIDPRLVRVQDHRRNAAPSMLGPSADGSGPAQAGWWLDLGDPNAPIDLAQNRIHRVLAELYRSIAGARVHLPDTGHLFEVPGPRWYRPWAPHLVLYGAKRQFRHGADGRFRLDGHLDTRFAGELMVGLRVGGHTVLGSELLADTAAFRVSGLPDTVSGLVAEHALTDAANAPIMTRVAHRTGDGGQKPTAAQLTAAARSIWLNRGGLLDDEQAEAIAAIEPIGTPSSAVGLQAWRDWYGPLFLDTEATHRRKRFNDAWALPPEHVETVDRDPVVAPDREQVVTERHVATVTVANVLRETLVTEAVNGPDGNPMPKKPAPNGVDAGTFDALDVVSASLTGLDDALAAEGQREQGGFLHMNRIRVYDTFGASAGWSSASTTLDPLPEWATAMPARLTTWGRLNLRLQSAADLDVEATPFDSPICGFLLPDFVDQALEVYDADGQPVGQLTATDPIDGDLGPVDATTLTVDFTPLPWVTVPDGEPTTAAITNATLRRFVEAVVAQSLTVAAGAPGWHETGFTAMLRVFDTVRSTLEPTVKHADGCVRLLGDPVVVLRARAAFEASDATVTQLREGPPTITDASSLPVLRVRIGDVTRPEDGVLGCFLDAATPADARFAPPTLEAAEKAVLNQMVTSAGLQKTRAITHPFVAGQVSEFDVPANQPLDLVVLADTRGSIYATCGVLPRKNIVMPKDFIEPALARLRPTFRVGPILGFERDEKVVPVMPAPFIEGLRATFVHDDDATFPEVPIPPVLGVGELPPARARLTEGWARMVPQEPG